MSNLMRIIALPLTILIAGCASGPSGKSFDSPLGQWNATWEQWTSGTYSIQLSIVDETKATYRFRDGRILFHTRDDQGKWEGYWVESFGKNNLCKNTKDGSNAWGAVVLRFNESYSGFDGEWDFCGEDQQYAIRGYR